MKTLQATKFVRKAAKAAGLTYTHSYTDKSQYGNRRIKCYGKQYTPAEQAAIVAHVLARCAEQNIKPLQCAFVKCYNGFRDYEAFVCVIESNHLGL